jgi:hypothetical protein
MTRRLAPVGLAVLAAGLAIAGCTSTGTTTAPPSASASTRASASAGGTASSARDALLASIDPLTKTSYKYTLTTGGLTGKGANDPANKKAMLDLSGQQKANSVTINVVTVGTDMWMKLNFGTNNNNLNISTDKWFHVDATKLGANPNLPVDPNGAANTANLLTGAVDVQSSDSHHFSGTVDLTKGTTTGMIGQPDIDRLQSKLKAVPFTATTDDQNRISSLKIDLSAVDPSLAAVESKFSDYGTTVTVNRPDPAQVVEAPDSVYQLFKK